MGKIDTEYDEKALLSQVELEVRTKRILNKPDSKLPFFLAFLFGTGVCNFLVNSSGFDAPIAIRVFLVTGVLTGIVGVIDNFMIRRKLDAAIALLLIQEKRHELDLGKSSLG